MTWFVDPYAGDSDAIQALYQGSGDLWWGIYNRHRQGLPLELGHVDPEWREPIREALWALRDTADAFDLVRSVYYLKKARDESKPEGTCPKCGDVGRFVRMALCCPIHGMFGGI